MDEDDRVGCFAGLDAVGAERCVLCCEAVDFGADAELLGGVDDGLAERVGCFAGLDAAGAERWVLCCEVDERCEGLGESAVRGAWPREAAACLDEDCALDCERSLRPITGKTNSEPRNRAIDIKIKRLWFRMLSPLSLNTPKTVRSHSCAFGLMVLFHQRCRTMENT